MTLLRFKNIKLQSYKPGKSLLAGNKNIIKLSANESALGVSKNVEKIVKSKFDISKYPDSKFSELTQKISKKYGCDKSKIICGSGSEFQLKKFLKRHQKKQKLFLLQIQIIQQALI